MKNWWLNLLLGILFLVAGLWMLFVPGATFMALMVLFSVAMFVSGLFEIALACAGRHTHGWGWSLAAGIIDLLLGAFLMFNPGVTAVVIPFIIAFWLLLRGVSVIGTASELQRIGVRGWGWNLVLGIAVVLAAVLIMWNPFAGAALAVAIAGAAMAVVGVFRIALALSQRPKR